MKRIIQNLFVPGIHVVFIGILFATTWGVHVAGYAGHAFILFMVLLTITTLPLFTYLLHRIETQISPVRYMDLYIQAVDSILAIESFDEMIKSIFDQILKCIHVRSGLLLFYYHDRDEYTIFYQKDRRKKIIRRANIENDNILFKVIQGADDVIIKSQLSENIHFERAIIHEIEKLDGEVVIPIYFHDIFLGLIIIGDLKRRLSQREIMLLKAFASKIATLTVNGFFFKEIVKKKELEKEYELALRIQQRFLPTTSLRYGTVNINVHHKSRSLRSREFFDMFINQGDSDDVRISSFHMLGSLALVSLHMPSVQSLLQSYARMHLSPLQCIKKLQKTIRDKEIMDEELSVCHAMITQSGEMQLSCHNYFSPWVYTGKKVKKLKKVKVKEDTNEKLGLKEGDIVIMGCSPFMEYIDMKRGDFSAVLEKRASQSIEKITRALVDMMPIENTDDAFDNLLIVLRVEGED